MDTEQKAQNMTLLNRFGGRSRWFMAELVVIIAGVLIALALDEWRGEIADAELEVEYMHQLISDLRSTEAEMAAAAATNFEPESAAVQLLAAFEDGEFVDLEIARQWLSVFDAYDNPVPVLGTAEALISTGDLGKIGDARVRSAITQYVSRSRDYWLGGLYRVEEQCDYFAIRILVLAEEHGISPGKRKGLFRGKSDSERRTDTTEYFLNAESYALVGRTVDLKKLMKRHRTSMSAEAAELRKLLEAQLPPKQ